MRCLLKAQDPQPDNKPFWFLAIVIAVLFLELPITRIAGGAFPITVFASTNSMQIANFWLSIIGGIIFLLLMIMYAYVYNNGRFSFIPEKKERTELDKSQKN